MERANSARPERVLKGGYSPQEVRHALWYVLVAWGFGAAFFAITTGGAFTSFLGDNFLKADDIIYSFIMAAGPAAGLLQFIGSYIVERTGRIKRNFLIFVTLHRLLWLGVAAVPLFMSPAWGNARAWVVGLFVFLSAASASYGGVGWTVWMSSIVPKSLAGKYFGYRARLGLLSMVITAMVVALLLDRFEGTAWMYAVAFGIAGILGATDILLFIPVREVPRPLEANPPSLLDIITTPWRNQAFRAFSLYTIISWVGYNMMGPFTWRFCFASVKEHGMGMGVFAAQILLFVIPILSMAAVAPFWGRAIDRFGPKPVMALSALCHIIIPAGWIFMRPELLWWLPVQMILGGLAWPGIDQVQFYMQLKEFPDERRSTYIATFAVIFGLAGTAGTLIGGYIASLSQQHLASLFTHSTWLSHYHLVFLLSILVRLVGFVVLFPRLPLSGSARHTAVARDIASGALASLPGMPSPARGRKKARSGAGSR